MVMTVVDKIYSLVSASLATGILPKDWKRANIVPIYKGGSRGNPLNYRLVSLTSVVGKMCERVVKDEWMRYLEGSNVLTHKQFGFRSGSSCTANLLAYYSRVVDVVQERDGWVDGVVHCLGMMGYKRIMGDTIWYEKHQR